MCLLPGLSDQALAETDMINLDTRQILDATAAEWGVEVALIELKDIQPPDSMKRAMARRQARLYDH
jgi:regulator of protease activity HflC (stomatin/prohibitin superfamily)